MSGICNQNAHLIVHFRLNAEGDATANPVVLDGIRKQIKQNLFEASAISTHYHTSTPVRLQTYFTLSSQWSYKQQTLFNDQIELYRLKRKINPAGFDLGQIQHIID